LYTAVLLAASASVSSAQKASEVFFSLSRAPLQSQSVPVDARTLKKKEIELYKPQNPAELLEHTPSISVRKMNGAYGASVLSMRGFSSKQTAVVVDDMKLPADLTGTVDFSALPASGIDRIEILPGGWSPLYGANAEGGIVHIISPKLPQGARIAEAGSEFSSYRGRYNQVKAGFAEKKVSALITGSNAYSDGFQQNSLFAKNAVTGVFSWEIPSAGRVTVRGFESFSRIGLPSGTPAPIADWNGKKERQANRLDDYQKSERNLVNAGYELPALGAARVNVSAGIGNNVVNAFQFNSMTRITLQTRSASVKCLFGDSVAGADYDRGLLSSDLYGRHTDRTYALFGQHVLRPAEGLEVVPAARYDDNKRFDAVFSPGVSLVYSPDFTWKFSARAAKAFQAPTFADLYDPFVPAADVSPNLEPEKSINYQAGGQWNSAAGFYAVLTGYRSDIKDRIALDAARSFAAYNLDTAFNRGLEGEIGYKGGAVKVTGTHTYNQSKGRPSGGNYRSLALSPQHRSSLVADIDAGPFNIFGKARYVSKQYTGRGHSGLRVPDFITADLSLSKKFGGVELSGGADNILDRHYAETADTTNGYYV
jgi:vitamin B12 transporter